MSTGASIIQLGPLGPWHPERSALLTISPMQAMIILENYNGHNRRFRLAIVDAVANALKDGTWQVNGETIIFGYDASSGQGMLLDGQNRLRACVDSGIPITTWVVFGLSPEAFKSIDRGANRSLSDDLSIRKEKNVLLLAASVRIAMSYVHGNRSKSIIGSKQFSSQDVFDFIDENPDIRESVHTINGTKGDFPVVGRVVVATHFLLGKKDRPLRDDFFDKLASGAGMETGNPILAARNRLFQNRLTVTSLQGNSKEGPFESMYIILTAWNHLRRSSKITNIVIRLREGDKGEKEFLLPEIA